MSVINYSGVSRVALFGTSKLLSSGGNTFFLLRSGLNYLNLENTFTSGVAGFLAFAMVYVTGCTQIPALYEGESPQKNNQKWTSFNHLCFVFGVLQGICVGLNAYLGSYTVFKALKFGSAIEIELVNSLFAISNLAAYYYFIVPKVIKNGFKVQSVLNKRSRYCMWDMTGVDKPALAKALLFGGLGVMGYSFLSYFNTSSAVAVIPGLDRLGSYGGIIFGGLSTCSTALTFSLSRLPGSYELQKKKRKNTRINKPCLNISHRFFGFSDLISFGFIDWTGSAQTFSELLSAPVPAWGLFLLSISSVSAAYLHYCFAIQILFDQAREESSEEIPNLENGAEGENNLNAATKLLR